MTLRIGVVLAGGASRRFGSDKAVAILDGVRLIDAVSAVLRPQVDRLVVVGRPGGLVDRPLGGHGPLAGINAGLHHARSIGFDGILSAPCDAPMLAMDLANRLGAGDATYAVDAPVVGWWPVALADALDAHIARGDLSMRGWIAAIGARGVDLGAIANVNTPGDLARLSGQSGPGPRSSRG